MSQIQFLDQHSGVLALLALVVAWLLFRVDRWGQRAGVIRGLNAELQMHGSWVGNPYSEKDRGSWPDPDYLVFKLVTVATDDAIARGPSLFLNRDLPITLINYRQIVGHFNQLIEKQMDFQANAELYAPNRPGWLVAAAVQITESIHIQGIGDASMQHPAAAFVFYQKVTHQLSRERDVKVLPLIWLVTGLNLFWLRRFGRWFLTAVGWVARMPAKIRRPPPNVPR